jgi:predicted dehydrogenase
MKFKVGIAGMNRGKRFLNEFKRHKNIEIVAVMDVNEKVLRKFKNENEDAVKYYFTDYEDLLDSDIDIVVIASPMQFHAKQSIMALERDIHVLCEVTAAMTLKECKTLLKASKRSKATYMMAENYCYIPENICINNMVKEGLFGDIYYAEGEYIHNAQHLHHDKKGNPTWRKKYQVGRPGVTYGTHSLGPVQQWFGERIVSINCVGSGPSRYKGYKYDDTTTMLCKTESGALINIRLDMMSLRPHNMRFYSLQGTKGCYEAPKSKKDDHKIWLKGYSKGTQNWMPLSAFYSTFLAKECTNLPMTLNDSNHWGSDYLMINDYLHAIAENKVPKMDIYQSLELTIPCILSEKSITTGGKRIEVPDVRKW